MGRPPREGPKRKTGPAPRPPLERFLAKVKVLESDCWNWTASLYLNGYGAFWSGKKIVPVHRWAYEYFDSPIPPDYVIDHLCRNPLCANPAHLEPVTNTENVMRGEGFSARNARATHCKHGHPFDAANTYRCKNGRRKCIQCGYDFKRLRRQAKARLRATAQGASDPARRSSP